MNNLAAGVLLLCFLAVVLAVQGRDSFEIADLNGDGSVDKAEFRFGKLHMFYLNLFSFQNGI